MKHTCNAPICAGDENPNYKNEVVWYPGEPVCTGTPYQKFQLKQMAINRELKEGTFKNTDSPYTAFELETKCI